MHQIFSQHVNTISKNKKPEQGVDDTEILFQRIIELERAIADYAQRYGLTDLARKTMLKVTANEAR